MLHESMRVESHSRGGEGAGQSGSSSVSMRALHRGRLYLVGGKMWRSCQRAFISHFPADTEARAMRAEQANDMPKYSVVTCEVRESYL